MEEGEGNFRLPQITTKQPDQRDTDRVIVGFLLCVY